MIKSFKDASNLIKQLKWSSLLTKYFKTFFLVLILPISLLNIFIYSSSKSSTNNEIESFIKHSSQIVANTINTTLNSFYNNYLLYSDNVDVQKYLSADLSDISSADFFSTISEIRKRMELHTLSSSYLDSVYLYSFSNNYVISNTSGSLVEYFHDKNWLEYYKTHKKNYFIVPQSTTYDDHISVCYELTSDNNPIGLIIFNFDLQNFKKSLLSNKEATIVSTILYNESNEIVFTVGEELNQSDIIKDNTSVTDIKIINNNKYSHALTPLGHSNAILQVSFFSEHLSMQGSRAILYLLLGFVISVVIALLLSLYLSFRFYESISSIIMQINDSTSNDFDLLNTNKTDTKFDELSFINQNISKLIIQHSLLENELYQTIANLKKMQIMTLQSQFNPHFLFNTLNHVSVLTLGAGENGELANRIIYNLSALLRISLSTKQYIIDARTEIDYVKKYIEIEEIKYKNKFDVVWDIDENICNCAVAKFMLQPIVENAFIHGIHKLKSNQKGILNISAHISSKKIVFRVKDNGGGIMPDKLQEIISQLNKNDLPDSKHIGLCNIHQRIKLIFGEDFGITDIRSDANKTTVELTLPQQPYK